MMIKEIILNIYYWIERKHLKRVINTNFDKKSYKEFVDLSDAEQWGKKYYQEWATEYRRNMRAAKEVLKESYDSPIEYYCGYVYREINSYLRFGEDKSQNGIYKNITNLLALSLVYAPRIQEDIVLYRLVPKHFIDELVIKQKEGIPAIEKGFISTSLLENIIKSDESYADNKYLIKMYVKKGTIGVYVPCVANRNHEQEMLLFPNGFFKMVDCPYMSNGKVVYECELFYFSFI